MIGKLFFFFFPFFSSFFLGGYCWLTTRKLGLFIGPRCQIRIFELNQAWVAEIATY